MNDQAPPTPVIDLSVDELAAVMRNDTDVFPDAGRVEVPAALERLRELAGRQAFEDGDTVGPREARKAGKALEELELAEERPLDDVEAAATVTAAGDVSRLEAAGYQAIRAQVVGAAQGIFALDAELLDELIAFAVDGSRKLEARADVPRDRLEAVTNELGILRAARHFHRDLGKLAQGAAARAAILGG